MLALLRLAARLKPVVPLMRRSTALSTLLACLLALALPAVANANAADDRIVRDCQTSQTGALTGSYQKSQLRHALRNLPGDVREYSGCYDAIRQAVLASAGGDPGGEGGGASPSGGIGGTSSTGGTDTAGGTAGAPAAPPHNGTESPVEIAGTAIAPGELPSIGHDAHELPDALVVALALLGLAALVPAALTIGRRVVARRRA